MAEKPTPPTPSGLNVNPPPPASNVASNSNAPFTPRSTTFPDGLDSDSEFEGFEPTPVHSPGGPQYDDLPPSYDEAQQQALQDARDGVPPLDPNNLEVHRMVLNDDDPPPPAIDSEPHRSGTSLLSNPGAYEFEPENRQNASGLGMNVPVQGFTNTDQIPVGQTASRQTTGSSVPDPTTLLNRALEFTRHEPDADTRYAPRLIRSIAIPQQGVPTSSRGEHRGHGRHRGCGRRERGRRARGQPQMGPIPGQWPNTASSETIDTQTEHVEDPVQFLRAYAKALHAHSIRPAEFTDFLDGLNALCLATNTSPVDLIHPWEQIQDSPSSIVQNYINSANEAFFAPRGLRVSLQSLSTLVQGLRVPEERGQRAGAVASVLDSRSTAERRAQALHPWIAGLETVVPAPSTQTLVLQEMSQQFHRKSAPPSLHEEEIHSRGSEKSRATTDSGDPPHSIPQAPRGPVAQGFPPFGGNFPWGRGGRGGFGGPGHGPWGRYNHGHGVWGGRGGRGGRGWGGRGFGAGRGWNPRGGCNPEQQNEWAAWGESVGKMGEEFGKRMQEWGEQFGKRAEEWGNNVGRRAEAWGDGMASRAGGQPGEKGESSAQAAAATPPAYAASPGHEGLAGQETGVHRGDSNTTIPIPTPQPALQPETQNQATSQTHHVKKSKAKAKAAKDEGDDDDSSSSDSDSSLSSDSEDSDSDSDGEEDYPDPHALFLDRVHSINASADNSRMKGKKSPEEITRERDIAIEKAQSQRTQLEVKIEQKRQKRVMKKELRRRKREIRKEHRRIKRELKGLGKKSKERRDEKRKRREEWREARREHRRVKGEARREWRDARREGRRGGRDREVDAGAARAMEDEMVWVVVENLA